ncbi:hypothetical protein GGF32_009982 [Allomyces javanicus]|nr:hypothetical protein GGF32_009982 [Allomyces javanicus]
MSTENTSSSGSTFDDLNQRFLAFLSGSGATISPDLVIKDYSTEFAGRGVAATGDLPTGETLFTIPLDLCLSYESARVSEWVRDHPALFENGWAPAILAVLYEYVHRDTSKWKAYFDILPETLDTPVFWTDAELAHLAGTDVPKRVAKDESQSLFENVILPALREHVSDTADLARFTPDAFFFAASLLMAYGFHVGPLHEPEIPDDDESDVEEEDPLPVLVPLADTLNAVHPASAHLERDGDKVAMTLSRDVVGGAQIYNTYGDHSTNELLRRYGYVEWENEFDHVSIDGMAVVGHVMDALKKVGWSKGMSTKDKEKTLAKRLEFLEEIEVFEDEFEVSVVRPVPADLVLTIKLLLLDPDQYKAAKKDPALVFPSLSKFTDADPTQPIDRAVVYLTKTEAAVLRVAVTARLAEYPETPVANEYLAAIEASTDLAAYLARVVPGMGNVRVAYAYVVRFREQRLLRQLLAALDAAEQIATWKDVKAHAMTVQEADFVETRVVIVNQAYPLTPAKRAASGAASGSGKKEKKAKQK